MEGLIVGEDYFESILQTGSLYIKHEDGTETEIGKIKDLDVTIDVANGKDFTSYNLGKQNFDGSFSWKAINKNIFRQLTDNSYRKYLKRIKNRNNLYNKLKKLGRKL
jgi:hypothetical protein